MSNNYRDYSTPLLKHLFSTISQEDRSTISDMMKHTLKRVNLIDENIPNMHILGFLLQWVLNDLVLTDVEWTGFLWYFKRTTDDGALKVYKYSADILELQAARRYLTEVNNISWWMMGSLYCNKIVEFLFLKENDVLQSIQKNRSNKRNLDDLDVDLFDDEQPAEKEATEEEVNLYLAKRAKQFHSFKNGVTELIATRMAEDNELCKIGEHLLQGQMSTHILQTEAFVTYASKIALFHKTRLDLGGRDDDVFLKEATSLNCISCRQCTYYARTYCHVIPLVCKSMMHMYNACVGYCGYNSRTIFVADKNKVIVRIKLTRQVKMNMA